MVCVKVTDPAEVLPMTTEPLLFTVMFNLIGLEGVVPKTRTTSREAGMPLALAPLVLAFMLHGFTLTTLPRANGDSAGKVEAVTVKIHDPKVVTPDAVLPLLVIVKAGVALLLVKATVVGPARVTGVALAVLSVPEKPLLKVATIGAAFVVAGTKAATLVAVTAAVISAFATGTVAGESLPPQAANAAANVRPKANLANLTPATGNFCIFIPLLKLMDSSHLYF